MRSQSNSISVSKRLAKPKPAHHLVPPDFPFDIDYRAMEKDGLSFTLRSKKGLRGASDYASYDRIEFIGPENNILAVITHTSYKFFVNSPNIVLDISDKFTPDMFEILFRMLKQTQAANVTLIQMFIADRTSIECIKVIPEHFTEVTLRVTKDHDKVMSLLPEHINTLFIDKNFPLSSMGKIPVFIHSLALFTNVSADFIVPHLQDHIQNLSISITEKTTAETIKNISTHVKKLTIRRGDLQSKPEIINALASRPVETLEFINYSFQFVEAIDKARTRLNSNKREAPTGPRKRRAPTQKVIPLKLPRHENPSDNNMQAQASTSLQIVSDFQKSVMELMNQVTSLSEAQIQQTDKLKQLQTLLATPPQESEKEAEEKEPKRLSPLRANSAIGQRQYSHSQPDSLEIDNEYCEALFSLTKQDLGK